jgi:hypothetical protein
MRPLRPLPWCSGRSSTLDWEPLGSLFYGFFTDEAARWASDAAEPRAGVFNGLLDRRGRGTGLVAVGAGAQGEAAAVTA